MSALHVYPKKLFRPYIGKIRCLSPPASSGHLRQLVVTSGSLGYNYSLKRKCSSKEEGSTGRHFWPCNGRRDPLASSGSCRRAASQDTVSGWPGSHQFLIRMRTDPAGRRPVMKKERRQSLPALASFTPRLRHRRTDSRKDIFLLKWYFSQR